jgi:hypothetical protein
MPLPGFASFNPGYKNKGKRNAGKRGPYHPHAYGVRGAPRKERLAPPFPLSGALACRRSTSALPKGCVVPWCDPGQASSADRPGGGGHSADGVPTSSDAPRTPVVMPAGMMPGPPGSRADEAKARGHRTRPCRPASPGRRPLGRDDSLHVTHSVTIVNRSVTENRNYSGPDEVYCARVEVSGGAWYRLLRRRQSQGETRWLGFWSCTKLRATRPLSTSTTPKDAGRAQIRGQ